MRIFSLNNKAECRLPAYAAAALGNFDGVHLGHRRLFESLPDNMPKAVFTFADLPRPGVRTSLCGIDERLNLIAECGVEFAVVAEFGEVRDMSPADFADFLCGEIELSHAVCGYNFTFGKHAAGNASDLVSLLSARGAGVTVVPPVEVAGEHVSSTAVRKYISDGDIECANVMLGRAYSLTADVIHGNEIGRTIGVPTINQAFPENRVVPKYGVYASRVDVNGVVYPGVCNVGVRPTVDGANLFAETFLIGYSGWLYGEKVTVEFMKFLRSEMKFTGLDELRAQIALDIDKTKEYFR